MNYYRCSKDELETFARDRGIHVSNVGQRRPQNRRRNIIDALNKADENPSFRFLDLPPELRNMVYRELLVFKQSPIKRRSPKCHPQILCASKEVNREATGILYGDNLIVVKIRPEAVYAHGVRCGTYAPQTGLHGRRAGSQCIQDLVWPELLSRARAVHVVVLGVMQHGSTRQLPNCGTIHNILFSLCLFLRQATSLKTVTVDLGSLTNRYVRLGRADFLERHLPTAIYPIRLLRDGVAAEIITIDDVSFEDSLPPNSKAVELAGRIASGSIWTAIHQLQVVLRLGCFLCEPTASPASIDEFTALFADGLTIAIAGYSFLWSRGDSGRLRRRLSGYLRALRDLVDSVGMDQVPRMLGKQLERILMLGVELERAERNLLEG